MFDLKNIIFHSQFVNFVNFEKKQMGEIEKDNINSNYILRITYNVSVSNRFSLGR